MAEEQLYAWLLISFDTSAGGLSCVVVLFFAFFSGIVVWRLGVGHYYSSRYLILYLFIISILPFLCICNSYM